ncbi:MAG: flavodoxin family protein [Deltaproteobacteria bacterium]|nr:flavodoxin family protein [Candidatus Anaeroferrophillacea bacterium]
MAKVLIVYDSLRGNTKRVADLLAERISAGGHQVTLEKPAKVGTADLEGADFLIFGAPTYHKDLIGTMKTFLFKASEANLADHAGAAFSTYGWSGESLGILEDTMRNALGMKLVTDGLAVKQTPMVAKVKEAVGPFADAILASL